MGPPPKRVKKRLRDDVREFVGEAADYVDRQEIEMPQTAVYSPPQIRRSDPEMIVNKPSKLFDQHSPLKQWFFNDTAAWLLEEELGFDIPPALDTDNDEGIRPYYRKRLFEFAKLVLDYTGEFVFNADAFEAAFKDYFFPRYSAEHEYEVIIPLPNLSLRDPEQYRNTSIEFSAHTKHEGGPFKAIISDDLVISRLNDSELAGLRTYGVSDVLSSDSKFRQSFRWYHKLMVPVKVNHLPSYHEDDRPGIDPSWTAGVACDVGDRVASQLVSSLRLYSPRGFVGMGPTYCLGNSWRVYRGLCQDILTSLNGSEALDSPVIEFEMLTIQKTEYSELQNFWEEYAEICDPENDSPLATPVSRFNKTFYGQDYTDRIIDCYLGFENTLANDEGTQSFRFPSRAVFLFQNLDLYFKNGAMIELEFVYNFFSKLHYLRNSIIHGGGEIDFGPYPFDENLPGNPSIDDLSSREFVIEARFFLAQAIKQYHRLLQQCGISIKDINRKQLDPKIERAIMNLNN